MKKRNAITVKAVVMSRKEMAWEVIETVVPVARIAQVEAYSEPTRPEGSLVPVNPSCAKMYLRAPEAVMYVVHAPRTIDQAMNGEIVL